MAEALTLAALIPKNQTLTIIRPDATLKHALEVLYGARITAIPVVDNKKVIGMLDVLDIVAFLAHLNKKSSNLVYIETA
jgi:predicted transcriptional regulator